MSVTKATIAPFLLAVFGAGLVGVGLQAADRARRPNPAPSEIWSGKPQNELLKRILKHRLNKARSPSLDKDALEHINVTDGAVHGNMALLRKDGGKLKWPEAFEQAAFDKVRARLAKTLVAAVEQLKKNKPLDGATLDAIRSDHKALNATLNDKENDLSVTQYIESKRFLNQLNEAIRALSDKSAVKHFNGTWKPQGKNIAELVWWMSKQGLIFAPAVPGDESTYTSLYNSLRDYESALESAR